MITLVTPISYAASAFCPQGFDADCTAPTYNCRLYNFIPPKLPLIPASPNEMKLMKARAVYKNMRFQDAVMEVAPDRVTICEYINDEGDRLDILTWRNLPVSIDLDRSQNNNWDETPISFG